MPSHWNSVWHLQETRSFLPRWGPTSGPPPGPPCTEVSEGGVNKAKCFSGSWLNSVTLSWKSIQPAASDLYFVISEGSALITLSSQESRGWDLPGLCRCPLRRGKVRCEVGIFALSPRILRDRSKFFICPRGQRPSAGLELAADKAWVNRIKQRACCFWPQPAGCWSLIKTSCNKQSNLPRPPTP